MPHTQSHLHTIRFENRNRTKVLDILMFPNVVFCKCLALICNQRTQWLIMHCFQNQTLLYRFRRRHAAHRMGTRDKVTYVHVKLTKRSTTKSGWHVSMVGLHISRLCVHTWMWWNFHNKVTILLTVWRKSWCEIDSSFRNSKKGYNTFLMLNRSMKKKMSPNFSWLLKMNKLNFMNKTKLFMCFVLIETRAIMWKKNFFCYIVLMHRFIVKAISQYFS